MVYIISLCLKLEGIVSMENSHVRVILQGIDRQIEEFKKKLMDLERAREAFIKQHDSVLLSSSDEAPMDGVSRKGVRRRLPAGIPRKWILEALQKQTQCTIAEINGLIETLHGRMLADGTLRRVVDKLKDEGRVFYRQDEGTWELMKEDSSEHELTF